MATKSTTSSKKKPAKGTVKTNQQAQSSSASSFGEMIDRMSPRFSFRIGMMAGALLLSAALFVFLFLSFALGGGISGSLAGDSLKNDGVLPDPYPVADVKLEIKDDDHVQGDRSAEFAFIEYSDLECPFCQRFHVDQTIPSVRETLATQGVETSWVYRHFPLDFHEGADVAAEMSECVADEAGNDGFWAFVETYFEETGANGIGIEQNRLIEIAQESGATAEEFASCLDEGRFTESVAAEIAEATKEYNMGTEYGTPTTFILDTTNGNVRAIIGAYDASVIVEAVGVMRDER